jgi:acetyl/propionyl-CoA carboxylase alpha subunit
MTTNNRLVPLAALLVVALAVPAAQAAIAQAATFDEKVDNSAAIILGKCIKTEAKFDPSGRWIVTYATFAVEQSMKGDASGQLTVVTPGGTVNGIHQETIGVPVFQAGDEHVVFLRNTRLGPSPLYFDQGTYNVAAGDHGEKLIVPMPSNVIHIDAQRGMAVAPADEPRTLEAFKSAVSESMRGTQKRLEMSAMAKAAKAKPQTSIWTTLAANKLLVALALVGLAIAGWQLWRR